jgi:hypothetical protein
VWSQPEQLFHPCQAWAAGKYRFCALPKPHRIGRPRGLEIPRP